MSKGKVKEYDPERGCGVIIDSDSGQRLTVYANFIKLAKGDTLHKDQSVEFEVEKNLNNIWAVNVRLA